MAHRDSYVGMSPGLLLWVYCLVSTGFPVGIELFFDCFLIHAGGFEAFFYGFAVLTLLSVLTSFFVGPVEGVLSGVFG